MKMKLIALMAIPLVSFADGDYQVKVLTESAIPHRELPPGMKVPSPAEEKRDKERGYIDSDSPYPKTLLEVGHKTKKSLGNGAGPIITDLSTVKLAFPFTGISFIKTENIAGYQVCPVDEGKGYMCVTEYFNDYYLGTCALILQYVYGTGGSITYSEENVEYYVNNKPGNQMVSGSDKNGFLLYLLWSDNKFEYRLSCANMKFDKNMVNEEIQLANKIDNDLNKPE